MKTSNKSNIITGAVLLSLSAAFTISLILQLLNFGVGGPGHDNLFFLLGNILYTVYGFSSLWIPVFLLITGLSCFATKWTAKRTVRLLTAIVPFFTSVITENICRSILKLESSSFPLTKIIISLLIGAMLIVIEFLFAGIIADRVNDSYYRITKQPRPAKTETPEVKTPVAEKSEKEAEISTEAPSEKTEETAESSKEESPFDAALSTLKLSKATENQTETSSTSDSKTEANEIPETNNSIEENGIEETIQEPIEAEKTESAEPTEVVEEAEDDEPVTPATILTQEEYAALIQQDPIADDDFLNANPTEETVEELEWNNLPPAPETLPPEYDEDYSEEDDKALEFPPKEEEPLETEIENENRNGNVEEPEFENSEDTIIFDPSEVEDSDTNFDDDFIVEKEDENFSAKTENDDLDIDFTSDYYSDFDNEESEESVQENYDRQFIQEANALENELLNDIDSKTQSYEDFIDESQFQPSSNSFDDFDFDEDTEDDEASEDEYESVLFEAKQPEPVAPVSNAPKYYDSVVENPSYPHGIKIHNETQKKVPTPQKQDTPKPLYPTTISLGEQNTPKQYSEVPETSTVQQNNPSQEVTDYPQSAPAEIDPDFYDIDANETAEAAAAIEKNIQAKLNSERIIKQRQKQMDELAKKNSASPRSFSNFAADVFSDMENDILENSDSNNSENNYNAEEPTISFTKNTEHNYPNPALEAPSQGPSTTANDLTSDDLNAFFNAQEEENTPRTKEIQGNAPRTNNRAQPAKPYVIPSDLLTAYKDDQYWLIDEATKQASINLTQTLAEFNIEAQIIGIKKGPVVTMFELLPAPGVKLSKIVALQDNIALSLAASSVRIVAPIPGKQAVGIEVPNKNRSIVGFREIIEMPLPEWDKMAVPVILGKDILGKPQLIDLVKTPHMLIAGATGSGKSVCVNSLILSILYKRSYKDVKLILVDPKVVELKLYNNIPHLLTPVITEPKKAFQALQYCLCEMERRYALLDGLGVRDISTYNQRIKERNICTEKLPYIVVIIDEFADLMATTGRELESVVARLTAMSRAVGIHLVLATQRPSVNVITGLIKANIPSRIAFMVASRTDSNIIIDSVGAEKLLGRGDMLYTSAVDPYPVRIQGTFVSDQEVENVVNCVKEFGEPDYIDDEIFVEDDDDMGENVDLFGNSIDEDPLYDQALEIVVQAGKASASYIQRRLKIGYNRAARLVEEMEERGIVGPANGSKPREIIHMP